MTNEEAIKAIKANYPSGGYEDLCEALDIAIKALSEPIWHPYPQEKPTEERDRVLQNLRKKGHWKATVFCGCIVEIECSECGAKDLKHFTTRYCPNCGAKMEGADNE